MKKPTVIEVRYKRFSDLDYTSGAFFYYDVYDLPHAANLIFGVEDDEYDEITLRIMSDKDVKTMTEGLIAQEEVDMLYDMFEIDPFENTVIVESEDDEEDNPDVVEIEIYYINDLDQKLMTYYKEQRDEREA